MRRMLLLCAVLFMGCAKSEPPASQSTGTAAEPAPAAISLADVAGTWDGTVTAAGSDSVLTLIEVTATAEATGWSMTVTNAKTPTMKSVVPATSVVAAGDSVVVEAGPFQSVLRKGQQVSTHTVYRLQDGKLVGSIEATYAASGDKLALHSVATRRATP
jgi:hypothetical protein